MKVSQLTRISSPAPEICSNFVLLTWDVLNTKIVFLYCHGPMEHSHSGRQHTSSISGVYGRTGV